MKKAFIFFGVFCSLFSGMVLGQSYKNIYILLEPSSGGEEGVFLNSDAIFISELVSALPNVRPAINKLVLHIAGLNKQPKEYRRKELKELKVRKISQALYATASSIGKYNIAKDLSNLSNHLDALSWKGSETLFVILGDINYLGKGDLSSHGSYLNSAWLSHACSPFVRHLLKHNNDNLQGAGIIVFTRTQLDLMHERKRKDFILNLFSDAHEELNVFYVGGLQNSIVRPGHSFGIDIVKKAIAGNMEAIEEKRLLPTKLVQIVNNIGNMSINLCE